MKTDHLYRALRTAVVFIVWALVVACGEDNPEPGTGPVVNPPGPEEKSSLDLYREGKSLFKPGNNQDFKQAFDLFLESANKGCDSAQVATGFMYEYGLGTDQDIQQAVSFYEKAAAQGNEDAKDKVMCLRKARSSVVFPEGYSYPVYKLHVWSADTLRAVNGNHSLLTSSASVFVTDENDKPVFLSFQSADEDMQVSEPITIDAKETAVSLLLVAIPFVFNAQDDIFFKVAKEAIGELPETENLTHAIEASIVRNGHLELDDVRQELSAGSSRIMSLLGHPASSATQSPRASIPTKENRYFRSQSSYAKASTPVNKPEIVYNGNIVGAVWAEISGSNTTFNSTKNRDEWKVKVYNSLPLYFALIPAHIQGDYVSPDPYTQKTEFIVKPSNITDIYKDIGLKGVKEFWKNQWTFWTEDLGYLIETLQSGEYEEYRGLKCNQTSGSAMVPINSDDDVLLVTSVDTNTPLLAYGIADIIVMPLFKKFIKIKKKNEELIWALITNEFLKYFTTKNINELVVAIQNNDVKKYRKLLMTIVEDFFKGIGKEFFTVEDQKEALNQMMVGLIYEDLTGDFASLANLDPILAAIKKIKEGLEWVEIIGNSLLWAEYQFNFSTYGIFFSVETDNAPELLEPVDLGLSVYWANCNVGATSPRGNGRRYAWGETTHKDGYSWSNYAWGASEGSMNKYILWPAFGSIDGLSILEPNDDVATKLWGEKWRMPTDAEFQELIDYCQWEVSKLFPPGYYVKSRKTDNLIFLSAAGAMGDELTSMPEGSWGQYWTSSLYEGASNFANMLRFHLYEGNNDYQISQTFRYVGQSVRPVADIARLEVSDQDLDLGVARAGSVTKRTITLSNKGIGTMTLRFKPISGPFMIDKSFNTDYSVQSDGEITVTITFSPPSNGSDQIFNSPLVIETNCKHTPEVSIALEGRKDLSQTTDLSSPVDLGLSVKWATINIGASSREDFGAYVAWGELEEDPPYVWENYTYCNGTQNLLTKYYSGDGKKELDSVDDIARSKMGADWRMPTEAEFGELTEDCDWSDVIELNGVNGRFVYNPKDHLKYIFLPMAGYMFDHSVYGSGEVGFYWTSTLWRQDYRMACSGKIEPQDRYVNGSARSRGLNVRAVYQPSSSSGGGLDDIPGHNL